MSMANVFRLLLIGSYKAEVRRLRRIDVIRGHRLATETPAVRVFSAKRRLAGSV